MSEKFADILIHHGVKGMKWGIRKDRSSKKSRKPKKETAVQRNRKQALARRRTMKQKDIDALIRRLEQEKKLKSLLQEDLSPGRTFVANSLKTSGGKVLTAVATGVAVTAVAAVLASDKWGSGRVGRTVSALSQNIPKIRK